MRLKDEADFVETQAPQVAAQPTAVEYGLAIERRMVELQPIRTLGEHKAHVRLTVDLTPEVRVIVHREGEVIAIEEAVEEAPAAEETEQQ